MFWMCSNLVLFTVIFSGILFAEIKSLCYIWYQIDIYLHFKTFVLTVDLFKTFSSYSVVLFWLWLGYLLDWIWNVSFFSLDSRFNLFNLGCMNRYWYLWNLMFIKWTNCNRRRNSIILSYYVSRSIKLFYSKFCRS